MDRINKLEGIVKWFNSNKGYGMILSNNKEIFVHYKNISTNKNTNIFLEENEKVRFKMGKKNNKVCAIDVEPISGKFICEKYIHSKKNKKLTRLNKTKLSRNSRRRKKNTESFEPSFKPADLRITVFSGKNEKYTKQYYDNEVILVNNLFENDTNIYNELLEEMKKCNIPELFKLWHGDTHLIADDHLKWKEYCPKFKYVIDKMAQFFNVDVKATRFNWYKNSDQWKPYHHDAAALKPEKAAKQNITIGVSFGSERDVSFEHAEKRTVVTIPLEHGSIYTFGKNVNIEWRHGIPQVKPENKHNKGRISIIIWGKV
jgi:cold shock CspA family protein